MSTASRGMAGLQAQFYRIETGRRANKAIVTLAISVLTAIYCMLKDGTMCQDSVGNVALQGSAARGRAGNRAAP